ncbi:butyrophilin-like protein 3 [Dasypus novemcinctus]|uniref:butyrophilin-like protein 3 n=1 Tax=Dasypus novemcinctus TaxID=9361 RepID=UPI0039C93FEA
MKKNEAEMLKKQAEKEKDSSRRGKLFTHIPDCQKGGSWVRSVHDTFDMIVFYTAFALYKLLLPERCKGRDASHCFLNGDHYGHSNPTHHQPTSARVGQTDTLFVYLSVLFPPTGQWQVIGPNKPVQALVGEDTVFSCFLSPGTSAEAMEVRFFRNQFSTVVHLYRNGKDLDDMQVPTYQGRTELLKDSIVNGHVSLRLKNIIPSDAGLYGCWFSSQTYYQEAIWELQVLVLGSTPLVSMVGYVDGEIQISCQSSGWFPQPTVKWIGPQGHDLPSGYKVNTDKDGLFEVETYLTVQEDAGSISCSIQHVDQTRKVETRIWIGETFFQPSPWRLASVLLGLLCFSLCVCIIGKIILFLKYQRKLQAELDWRKQKKQAEWRDAREHSVEVTLDQDSAHPQLFISNLRSVTYMDVPQPVPYSEKRFKKKCVVASQGFSAGKHYWEVDVGPLGGWCLGVCLDDVDRKMQHAIVSPLNVYWVLGKSTQNQYFSFNPSRIYLSPTTPLTRIGIFLDYEGGTISFFNINDQSLIYTQTHQFAGLLRPYFQPLACYGENRIPIVICPVSSESHAEVPSQSVPTSPITDKREPSSQMTTPFLSKSDAQRGSRLPLPFRLSTVLPWFQSSTAANRDGFQMRGDSCCPEFGREED